MARNGRAVVVIAILVPWMPMALGTSADCDFSDAAALPRSADWEFSGQLAPGQTQSWVVHADRDDTLALELRLPRQTRADAFFTSPSGGIVALRHVFGPSLGGTIAVVLEPGMWQYCLTSLEDSPIAYTARLVHAPPAETHPSNPGGVTIAILDTGIDPRHPDIAGSRIIAWKDFIGDESGQSHAAPYDDMGHGTAVASLAVHDVPGAQLVVAKVFSRTTSATWTMIAAAARWAIENASVDVLVLSIEDHTLLAQPSAVQSSLFKVLSDAYDAGIVIVAANGNAGAYLGSLHPPTSSPYVLAVGSATGAGGVSGSSDLEPNLIALGENVCAARATGTFMTLENHLCVGSTRGSVTGTSFAAPQVASWAAQLKAVKPGTSPGTVKLWLLAAAHDIALVPYAREGFGFFNDESFQTSLEYAENPDAFRWCDTRVESRLAYRSSQLTKATASASRLSSDPICETSVAS